jgi:hypothetical protein
MPARTAQPFTSGDLVRMEYPWDAEEDRLTGRELLVRRIENAWSGRHVVVTDGGREWRVHPESLVLVIKAKALISRYGKRP